MPLYPSHALRRLARLLRFVQRKTPKQGADVLDLFVPEQVADPPVEVETELVRQDILARPESVTLAAGLEEGEVDLMVLPAKHLPGEDVPVLDARLAFQLDELILGVLGLAASRANGYAFFGIFSGGCLKTSR